MFWCCTRLLAPTIPPGPPLYTGRLEFRGHLGSGAVVAFADVASAATAVEVPADVAVAPVVAVAAAAAAF